MPRIFSVTPIHVEPDELDRRRRRYAELAPDGLTVELVDAGPGAPAQLAAEADLEASEGVVAAALAGVEGYDFLMPDCVLDPGVPEGARGAGMLRVVVDHLVAEGHRVAAVTRNKVIGDELARKVREYGHGEAFLGVAVLDLDVDAIADTAAWNGAMRSALDGLAAKGATAVINGCSAVEVEQPAGAPLVVDPAAVALRLLAS
ncbi:aspartate/glutamate racemase family protein [Amycolatopsis sp.]|uniref:aspartate/glutamate racemase family protein n=1 Tax=Amycolatopsis sp. TaxID=37632 RepID=UPI002C388581|nr:aspartate/glutamate racemase family protein [Amycolatopsis sp.]HVV09487.1 aspartate/glutamate racemase family protein [Amycolatopsis sp.]